MLIEHLPRWTTASSLLGLSKKSMIAAAVGMVRESTCTSSRFFSLFAQQKILEKSQGLSTLHCTSSTVLPVLHAAKQVLVLHFVPVITSVRVLQIRTYKYWCTSKRERLSEN
jgi:hypothetical protein